MEKPLKIYNGRGFTGRGDHLYICAKNRTHAAKLMHRAFYLIKRQTKEYIAPDKLDIDRACREIRDYFSEGCWGNSMNGITPEIGVWYSTKWPLKPVRVI